MGGDPVRRTRLNTTTPIKRTNPGRRKAAYERNFGDRAALVRAMPCLGAALGDCSGDIQAAHTTARKMGGAGGDRRCLVPLCAHHHAQSGEKRTSMRAAFELRVGFNLEGRAEDIAIGFDEQGVP